MTIEMHPNETRKLVAERDDAIRARDEARADADLYLSQWWALVTAAGLGEPVEADDADGARRTEAAARRISEALKLLREVTVALPLTDRNVVVWEHYDNLRTRASALLGAL